MVEFALVLGAVLLDGGHIPSLEEDGRYHLQEVRHLGGVLIYARSRIAVQTEEDRLSEQADYIVPNGDLRSAEEEIEAILLQWNYTSKENEPCQTN